MRACWTTGVALAVGVFGVVAPVRAVIVPYTEEFTSDSANWANFNTSGLLTHVASGGPDGGAYASGPLSFFERTNDPPPVVHRARTDLNASGGAFFGNWMTAGARKLRVHVRHDAPTPLNYFVRIASGFGFPGATAVAFQPVAGNQWTELVFDLSPTSPQIVTFEDSDWPTVFGNVTGLQFGVMTPGTLVNDQTVYAFDLDRVTVVPEPSSLVLVVVAGAFAWLPRRVTRGRGRC